MPVAPSKVVCIGRNYVAHIHELGNEVPTSMVLFCKPNSAVTQELYYISDDTRFEGEIALMVRDGAYMAVGFGLDLTKADEQARLKAEGLPWERAKAFDCSAVFSPFVPLEVPLDTLRMRLYHNGVLVQEGGYDLMIYKPETILKEIEGFMSLYDGDIIMTGTPKGVGTYRRGDRFEASIFAGEEPLLRHSWYAA